MAMVYVLYACLNSLGTNKVKLAYVSTRAIALQQLELLFQESVSSLNVPGR